MKLRPHQTEIVAEAIDALEHHDRIVLSSPTGSGKTVMATAGIVPHVAGPIAWLTHRKELAKQITDHESPVVVGLIQKGIKGHFNTIFIDEGHHVCAEQYRRLIADYPNAKIIALTATPYRLDGVGLGSCGFTRIVHGHDILRLTEEGVLCRARFYIPRSESTVAWTAKATAEEIKSRKFRKAIVYCRSVEESKATALILRRLRISAESIDGTTKSSRRERVVDQFHAGKIRVICNHTIFTEGTDAPSVDLIVMNRATSSRCLWKQMIGRGLRSSPGKRVCTVLDLAGNGAIHGSVYDMEIYSLDGTVTATEAREPGMDPEETEQPPYQHNQGEELKEWKPQPKPISILESLQRLKSKSPLRRFMTA